LTVGIRIYPKRPSLSRRLYVRSANATHGQYWSASCRHAILYPYSLFCHMTAGWAPLMPKSPCHQ
jgi:hypothetical protein